MSSTVEFKQVLILKSELTRKFELQKLNNVNRIRNNQRRSRARRKEYLQKLKSKLRKYESMSVKASTKIQASVRLVVKENKRLRTLLQSRGVVSQEIDRTIATSSVEAQTSSRASILETKLNMKKSCTENVCKTDFKSRDGICKRSLISMSLMTTTTNSVSLFESSVLQNRLSSSSIATSAFSSMNSSLHLMNHYEKESLNLSFETSSDNNTTSCAFIIDVITRMRVDVSAEDVKAELECNNDVECKIDNSTFFVIMNRYTEWFSWHENRWAERHFTSTFLVCKFTIFSIWSF